MSEDVKLIQISEEEQIQNEFDSLLNDYLNSNHRKKVELITKAFNFANAAHKGIRRRDGQPYIMHPLAVARIVSTEIGMGSTSICAALLHDVVEDTDYTVEDIENLFGTKIAQIVNGLTKISGGVFAVEASKQAENMRRLLLTMSEDIRVILIKIADRLHNMRTLGSMPAAKQYKIAGETQFIYAPLAHRLGLFRIKTELENLSFRYDHPDTYAQIETRLAEDKEAREAFFKDFTAPIKNKLVEMNYDYFLKERVKSVYSIWSKMSTRNIPFEEVYDLLALRIIFTPKEGISEKDQCWMLYSAITNIYRPHPERIRDWVSGPKANGYESLHVTVMGPRGKWVEVQIRSVRMNEIAEKGLAAHWKYKTGNSEPTELDNWMKTLKEILENPEPNAIDFIDTFKLNLFASEIFAFTPKGEIKTIAYGATALDFAFAVHSELGMHCIGAKVNHKLVPLSYKLNSGDQIEILTSKKQTPQPEWENYVTTARAKAKLKIYFKKEERNQILEGQRIFEGIIKSLNIELTNEIYVKVLNHFNFSQRNTLFLQIAKESYTTEDFRAILKPKSTNVFGRLLKIPFVGGYDNKKGPTVPIDGNPEKIDRKRTVILSEENAGKFFQFAPCCKPIPGDDVLGFIDESEKLIIHKRACKIAAKLKSNHGERLVSAQWATHKMMIFEEIIEIKGIDKKGVMIEILKVISDNYGVNIKKIIIETIDGIFIGRFNILVHDTEDISNICNNINKIKEVKSTQRIQLEENLI